MGTPRPRFLPSHLSEEVLLHSQLSNQQLSNHAQLHHQQLQSKSLLEQRQQQLMEAMRDMRSPPLVSIL
jgi:hypothetical protein